MNPNSRRTFLKTGAALASSLSIAGCTSAPTSEAPVEASNPLETLEALGSIVLPEKSLGPEEVKKVVEGFRKWLENFEPVAELDHVYIATDEILYGPPDPQPAWRAQLEALDLESEKKHDASFHAIPREAQEAILRRQLPPRLEADLPEPARAPHVAIGLLAYFYQTSEANDLCYERAIEKTTCRGVESGAVEPPTRSAKSTPSRPPSAASRSSAGQPPERRAKAALRKEKRRALGPSAGIES